MTNIVVTGAGGVLGGHLVRVLQSRGRNVRGLGRGAAPVGFTAPWTTIDLTDDAALREVLKGGEVVVHAASDPVRPDADVKAAHALARAAATAGVAQIVYVQIAGVSIEARRVSRYYRDKSLAEEVLRSGAVPCSVMAATQFHTLMDRVCAALVFGPLILTPPFALQPVDPTFVAERLADQLDSRGAWNFTICGPQTLSSREMTADWIAVRRKKVLALPIPGIGLLAGFSHIQAVTGIAGGPSWGEWLTRNGKPQ